MVSISRKGLFFALRPRLLGVVSDCAGSFAIALLKIASYCCERLDNLSNNRINQIDKKLPREDGKGIRIETDNGYLVCSYSSFGY